VAETVSGTGEKRRELEADAPALQPHATHGGRFTIAYLLIMIVFAGVVGLFAYMVGRSESEAWSSFKPKGDGLARAHSIANQISRQYRLNGTQIAVVQAQPPLVENTPVDAIAIARETSGGVGGGYLSIEPAANTLVYVFCGLGNGCSLPGAPTLERGRLLRRESLELALYTFKYMDDVQSVVTLLPPRGSVVPAVYLRRRALEPLLGKPLHKTLSFRPPYTVGDMPDATTVERLTAHRFFPSRFQQLQNGRAILVLGGPQPQQQQPPPPSQQRR
jgi:hypothetical protein